MKISIKLQWNKLCVPLWASTAHWMCDGVNKHLYKCVLNREAMCVCVSFTNEDNISLHRGGQQGELSASGQRASSPSFSVSFFTSNLQILPFFVPSFLPLSFIEHDFSCIKMLLSASRLWWYLKNGPLVFIFFFFKLCFQITLVSLSFQSGFSYFSFHWYFSLFKSHVTGCISQNMFSSEDV